MAPLDSSRIIQTVSHSSALLIPLRYCEAIYLCRSEIICEILTIHICSLIFHIYIHCSEESLRTNIRSAVSYSELLLPLPESKRLWFAETASEWKRVYLDLRPEQQARPPSTLSCLTDASMLRCLPNVYDSGLTRLISLYSISSMVSEYRHSHAASGFYQLNNMRENVIAEESEHRRLLEILRNMRLSYESDETFQLHYWMLMVELISMHLFAPFEQIEIVAGKEGKDEAQAICPLLKRWALSQQARHAAWHAGQVIRLLRSLDSERFNDLCAVMAYQSALCLWIYGSICEAENPPAENTGVTVNEVFLDGNESLESQRWISLNRGYPTILDISSEQGYKKQKSIRLSSIEEIMLNARHIILSKYVNRTPSLLTRNTCDLLYVLGKAGKGDASYGLHGLR